jgi:integrase
MSPRHQDGFIFGDLNACEHRGEPEHEHSTKCVRAWHVRYYITRDGQRVQHSEKLHDRDNKHHSKTCKAVKDLADAVMRKVNLEAGTLKDETVWTLDKFYSEVFLPWCRLTNAEGTPNIKASTLSGWQKHYRLYLQPHLGQIELSKINTARCSDVLTILAKQGLGNRTVSHAKALGRMIFKRAEAKSIVQGNPWASAKPETKPLKQKPTYAYSLAEAQKIFTALEAYPEAQLVFCFAFFAGCRPSEITGIRYENIVDGRLYLKEAIWRGHSGSLKTGTGDNRPKILPALVLDKIERWWVMNGRPETGYLFASKVLGPDGKPQPKSAENVAYRVIRPVCEKAGVYWDGLYSARRGCATLMRELTGNDLAGQYQLAHRTSDTTEQYYAKSLSTAAEKAVDSVNHETASWGLLPATTDKVIEAEE